MWLTTVEINCIITGCILSGMLLGIAVVGWFASRKQRVRGDKLDLKPSKGRGYNPDNPINQGAWR